MLDILCFFAVNKSMGIHCELTCCSQHPRGQDLCAFSIASFVPYRPRLVAPALPPSRPALSACTALHQRAPCQPMRLQRRRVSRCTDMAATARQRRYGAQARRAGAGKRTTAQDPRAAGRRRKRAERVQPRRVQASARNAPWRLRARGCGTELRPLCVLRQSRADPECRIVFPGARVGHRQERDCSSVGVPSSPMREADSCSRIVRACTRARAGGRDCVWTLISLCHAGRRGWRHQQRGPQRLRQGLQLPRPRHCSRCTRRAKANAQGCQGQQGKDVDARGQEGGGQAAHPELLLQDHALSALSAQHGFGLREAVRSKEVGRPG